MNKNPLSRIQDYGQSVWLDFIRRSMLDSGELRDHGNPASRLQ
jgi:hypothetical protein